MTNTKLKMGVLLSGLLCLLVFSAFQHFQLKQLTLANEDLRHQLGQLATLESTNEHLTGRLSAALEVSQANQIELARLRGQSVKLRQLEQENAQLKTQRQQLDRQLHQAQLPGTVPDQSQNITALEVRVAPTAADTRTTYNLGEVELSPGVGETVDLGGRTNCVITATPLSDGNTSTQISMSATKADGTVFEIATSRITARPGQHCTISVGDRMIGLAVTLKPD
jgi:hypothetical protein